MDWKLIWKSQKKLKRKYDIDNKTGRKKDFRNYDLVLVPTKTIYIDRLRPDYAYSL